MRCTLLFSTVLCGVGLVVAPSDAANLLTNPGFEAGPGALFPGGVNILVSTNGSPSYTSGYTMGVWGAEDASAIGTSSLASVPPPGSQVINPNSGKFMMNMIGAGTGSYTQAWQLVDVTPYQTPINGGGVTADLSAFFNAPKFVTATGAFDQPIAGITLQFYDSSYLAANQQLNVPGVPTAGANSQAIPPLTWTQIGISNVAVPPGTSYILAQVLFNNASLTDPNNTDYDGYVDDASLTLNNVPEPASFAALSGIGLALLSRRRYE